MQTSHILIVCVASFCAGFTQGLAGFGSTLVALPLLALVMDLRLATPVCCILAMTINVVLICRLHGHIQSGAIGLLILAALPGMYVGAHVLRSVPGYWLKGVLALVILAFVIHSWRGARRVAPAGRGFGLVAGFLAGGLGASIGVDGPPIVAWASRQGFDRETLRGTLTAYFLLAGICVVATQFMAGLVTFSVLQLVAVGLPTLAVGLWAGTSRCGKISDVAFGRVILGVLVLTGGSLFVQALVAVAIG
jgi:uncharacterized protein